MSNESQIIRTEYSDLMKKSYIDYAMSVIIARALPDVRMNHTLLLFQGIFPQLSSFIIAQRGCPRQPLLIFLYAFTLPDFCCGPVWAVFPCVLPFLRRSPHGGTAPRPRFL